MAAGGHDYPLRQRGQSLVEYLMSNQSTKICAELDRENAHFSVSEAMIAAIEESKFYEWKCTREEEEDNKMIREMNEESDEEIRMMKMTIQAQCFNSKHVSNQEILHGIDPFSKFQTVQMKLY